MELDPDISTEQTYWWRIALELRLRQSNSTGFQDFFSLVMGQLGASGQGHGVEQGTPARRSSAEHPASADKQQHRRLQRAQTRLDQSPIRF